MRYNSIIVTQVRSLEVGDLFAIETVGQVISGKITGKAYTKYDLTPEQIDYMNEHELRVPEGEAFLEPLGGNGYYLFFGEFTNHPNHIYLPFDVNVVVFPTKDRKKEQEA